MPHRWKYEHTLSSIAKWESILESIFRRRSTRIIWIWGSEGRCTRRSQMVQWSARYVCLLCVHCPNVPSIFPGRTPDAVNLWIGDSRSVTSIHSGIYTPNRLWHLLITRWIRSIWEYIYSDPWNKALYSTPSIGRLDSRWLVSKRCIPQDSDHSPEQLYPHAIYDRASPSEPLSIKSSDPAITPPVRWSSIANPHLPGALPPDAHPINISVNAGETLYLPAGWWHHVRQGSGLEDREKTIAINWWYDIEGQGMSWVWLNLFRNRGVCEWFW